MPTSQATVDDLIARTLRPLTSQQIAWAATRLEDAFTQILARIPAVGSRLDAGTGGDPLHQLVMQVQVAMVLRVLDNPDGVLEESGDDYTRRFDASVSTGALYLTADEVAALTGSLVADGSATGAFTIRSGRRAGFGVS